MRGSQRGQLLRIAVQHLLHVMGDLAHGIGGSDGLLEGQGEENLRREGAGEAGGHRWLKEARGSKGQQGGRERSMQQEETSIREVV